MKNLLIQKTLKEENECFINKALERWGWNSKVLYLQILGQLESQNFEK